MTTQSPPSNTALPAAITESTNLARIRKLQIGAATKQQSGEPRDLHAILQSLNNQCPSWISTLRKDQRQVPLLQRANIPRRHHQPNKAFEANSAWAKVRNGLCSRAGKGYLVALIGNRGTGKTQAAVEAIAHRASIGQYALYVKAMEFFLVCRASMKHEQTTELDALAQFMQPSLLVIDEIGERAETAYEDRLLVYLLDKRYDAMLDTILIANMKPEAMRESLGPSVWDRLQETGGLIQCNWDSFRQATSEVRK